MCPLWLAFWNKLPEGFPQPHKGANYLCLHPVLDSFSWWRISEMVSLRMSMDFLYPQIALITSYVSLFFLIAVENERVFWRSFKHKEFQFLETISSCSYHQVVRKCKSRNSLRKSSFTADWLPFLARRPEESEQRASWHLGTHWGAGGSAL